MVKSWHFAALGLAAVLLTSCVVDSEHPLATPDSAKIDQRLLTDWLTPEGDTFHISAKDAHWMKVVITPKSDTSGRPLMINRQPEVYDMFASSIGHLMFLNVRIVDTEHPAGTYLFYRYEIGPDKTLKLWLPSQDKLAGFVRAGQIAGTIHQDEHPMMVGDPPRPDLDVHLTASSDELVKFISHYGADRVFDKTGEPLTRKPVKN
jgi:hypothetical protein